MGPVTVVFDTNVLVSALGFGGIPLEALVHALSEPAIRIVATEATLDEFARVTEYDRLPITQHDREMYLSVLRREAELVPVTESIQAVERDPDDDAFLECAVSGNADYLVSGDDHLLDLDTFRGIEIVSPSTFLARTGQ